MTITKYWIISQLFAFIGLIFVVISFQQKKKNILVIYRIAADFFYLLSMIFLHNSSAIILCLVGILRDILSLVSPRIKKDYIRSFFVALLVFILVFANILFWDNYLNILSMIMGILNIICFMQKNTKTIRRLSSIIEFIAIVYFALLLSPINVISEIISFVSIIYATIKLDIMKKMKS